MNSSTCPSPLPSLFPLRLRLLPVPTLNLRNPNTQSISNRKPIKRIDAVDTRSLVFRAV